MEAFDWPLTRMRSLHLYFGGWSESNLQNRGARWPLPTTYRVEAVGLKTSYDTLKIAILVSMWNWGQFREKFIFCQ